MTEDIEWLRDYVEKDRAVRGVTEFESAFDQFCERHCKAIESVLEENENLKQENKKLQESHDYIFDAYQDAGNKMFDYQEENENLKQSLIINKNLYEEVCNKNKELEEEKEQYKKDYYFLINKIENKIDKFDYAFEKAKRRNDKDRADYYWDLIGNFKKLLEEK